MLRVMIVEDNAIYRYAIKTIIRWEDYGFELTTEAINGKQALEYIKERRCDVIITDMSMPEMNGLDLIRQVKRLYPAIKFIALSSFEEFHFVKEAMRLGAQDYLLKHDLEIEGLIQVLEQVKISILKEREKLAEANASDIHLTSLYLKKMMLGENIQSDQTETAGYHFEQTLSRSPYIVQLLRFNANKHEEVIADSMPGKAQSDFLDRIRKENEHFYPIVLSEKQAAVIQSFPHIKSESYMIASALEFADRLVPIARSLQLSLSVGMSRIGAGYSALPDLFRQAEAALFQKIYADRERIFIYREAQPPEEGLHHTWMTQFTLAFRSENMKVIEDKIAYVFEWIQSSRLEMKHVKRLLFDLFALLPVFAAERKMKLNSMNHWHDVLLDSMDNLEPIGEMKEYFLSCCRQIFGQTEIRQSHRQDIRMAVEYINEHYNEDISVANIADVLNLSPNYLSKLFRSETGIRLVEYINQRRIEAAKRLLRETNLKVYEVGEKAGFQETSYFCKVFKELTGVTVTEYRKK
ncbi:Protein-glutamate methylesterase/protein-glutamine glutaminase [Paenibacillus sp. CECT 9249]|uniref:response regulator transcription factor n=1 Tax=Paenibacillus sp. CECT 9249 TaxID=2845385 RepID=UPI001E608278|nr:response regulator [Paenibacillus sp. CECT 9249]CAH0121564.1 Protein-glutamate methylesterase/protein-glutamine glutaminase [Paenibacillus sp. CECT 9249]